MPGRRTWSPTGRGRCWRPGSSPDPSHQPARLAAAPKRSTGSSSSTAASSPATATATTSACACSWSPAASTANPHQKSGEPTEEPDSLVRARLFCPHAEGGSPDNGRGQSCGANSTLIVVGRTVAKVMPAACSEACRSPESHHVTAPAPNAAAVARPSPTFGTARILMSGSLRLHPSGCPSGLVRAIGRGRLLL